ncbi:GTP-binding protein [Streptomyces calidiresistens]|uniref:Cobalamin biosynthesis protein CobW n=1 Tax=Streptomyces calidiresistens TaxID=1485586 RepID=A0A7W3T7G7_9ACTN|nr:GTP-binding protein [Streptomyces calidiresistens]MBB0232076.1 cobalamin biosynthesis protein CobW [Streptomyces calidiresistens]
MLPVVIVAGLHRDARRAVVRRLLREVPGAIALHHDLSAAPGGTVRRTLADGTGLTDSGETPLVNDCACCALREDLVPELERLADGGLCRLAVVELWDSVEPRSMAEVVAAHGHGRFELVGVTCAVDPALVLPCLGNGDDLAEAGLAAAPGDQRVVADTFARQLEYPPVLVLADGSEEPDPGADSASEGRTGNPGAAGTAVLHTPDPADLELLTQLHPTARRIAVTDPGLVAVLTAGFDPAAAAARQHPACALLPQEADAHGVTTRVWRARRPFHPARLHAALEDLACAAARSRGRFWLANRPDTLLSWDAAGGALCVDNLGPWLAALPDAARDMMPAERLAAAALDWDPELGDRGHLLVFVSPELDAEGITELLDSCLLTDGEYAAGPEAWRSLDSAFDELLDPAVP